MYTRITQTPIDHAYRCRLNTDGTHGVYTMRITEIIGCTICVMYYVTSPTRLKLYAHRKKNKLQGCVNHICCNVSFCLFFACKYIRSYVTGKVPGT